LSIQKPYQLAAAAVFAPPRANHEKHGQKVSARRREHILLAWRMSRVLPSFEEFLPCQRRESPRQHRGCDAKTLPKLIEPGKPAVRVPQDQYAPCIAEEGDAP